jgi:hypothetical protein
MIAQRFNGEELRELCISLSIDFESLGGEGNKAKAHRLIAFLERRGRAQELLETLGEFRPNVAWPAM